jgi:hypothetical protein
MAAVGEGIAPPGVDHLDVGMSPACSDLTYALRCYAGRGEPIPYELLPAAHNAPRGTTTSALWLRRARPHLPAQCVAFDEVVQAET